MISNNWFWFAVLAVLFVAALLHPMLTRRPNAAPEQKPRAWAQQEWDELELQLRRDGWDEGRIAAVRAQVFEQS